MYFEIYQDSAGLSVLSGQWRWRLKSDNHETIASGESYINKQDCLHAVELIISTNQSTPIKDAGGLLNAAIAAKLMKL